MLIKPRVLKGWNRSTLPLEGGLTRSKVAATFVFLFALGMDHDLSKMMKRPNALPPDQMTPAERRAELCGLLALGLIRLRMGERGELSDKTRESCLHCPPDQCLHATPTHRRDA